MGVNVIDADQWLAQRPGKGLGGGDANQERTDQAGAMSDGDGVGDCRLPIADCRMNSIGNRQSAIGNRYGLPHHRENVFDVGAAGDLGNHAAIFGVQIDLAGDDVGAHVEAIDDDRRSGFVAS